MKEKLTLRNILICAGAFLGLLAFCLSFADTFKSNIEAAQATFYNVVWGCKKVTAIVGGITKEATMYDAFGIQNAGALALPLIGLILVLLSAIGAVVVALFVKNEKIAKIALLVCAGLILVGGVFQFFTVALFPGQVADKMIKEGIIPASQRAEVIKGFKNEHGGAAIVITGILGILGGALVAVSQFIPNKKLAK